MSESIALNLSMAYNTFFCETIIQYVSPNHLLHFAHCYMYMNFQMVPKLLLS